MGLCTVRTPYSTLLMLGFRVILLYLMYADTYFHAKVMPLVLTRLRLRPSSMW